MNILPMNPRYHTLSDGWKYVPASETDICKTFKRERERLALEAKKSKPNKIAELLK